MNWKTVSILAFVVLVGCVGVLLATSSLFGNGPITVAVQIFAVLLMAWARLTFGARSFHAAASTTEGGLITRGPYRYLRHPIYAAIFYFIWAGIAAHLSLTAVLIGLLASAMLGLRMYSEERFLTVEYPEYTEYSRRTSRVVPFVY